VTLTSRVESWSPSSPISTVESQPTAHNRGDEVTEREVRSCARSLTDSFLVDRKEETENTENRRLRDSYATSRTWAQFMYLRSTAGTETISKLKLFSFPMNKPSDSRTKRFNQSRRLHSGGWFWPEPSGTLDISFSRMIPASSISRSEGRPDGDLL
jgi:hypothetical protein